MNREEETDIQLELKNIRKEVKRIGNKVNLLQNEIHRLEGYVEDCLQDLIDYLHPDYTNERIAFNVFKCLSRRLSSWYGSIWRTLREKDIYKPYGKLKERLDCIDNALVNLHTYLAENKTIESEEAECRAYV